jgi:NAD(P)H-nitrite reductase large subunit
MAIDNGADTVEAVSSATRACTGCGTCRERIDSMIGARAAQCPVKALQTA